MIFKGLKPDMILRRPLGHATHHLFFIKNISNGIVNLDIYTRSEKSQPVQVEKVTRSENQWNNYHFRYHDSEFADHFDFREFIKGVFESVKLDVIK